MPTSLRIYSLALVTVQCVSLAAWPDSHIPSWKGRDKRVRPARLTVYATCVHIYLCVCVQHRIIIIIYYYFFLIAYKCTNVIKLYTPVNIKGVYIWYPLIWDKINCGLRKLTVLANSGQVYIWLFGHIARRGVFFLKICSLIVLSQYLLLLLKTIVV